MSPGFKATNFSKKNFHFLLRQEDPQRSKKNQHVIKPWINIVQYIQKNLSKETVFFSRNCLISRGFTATNLKKKIILRQEDPQCGKKKQHVINPWINIAQYFQKFYLRKPC
jgi:hypothetical protein